MLAYGIVLSVAEFFSGREMILQTTFVLATCNLHCTGYIHRAWVHINGFGRLPGLLWWVWNWGRQIRTHILDQIGYLE